MNQKYSFQDLIDVMAKLRAPDGCPWDREQDYESILKCMVEEAYEYIDAVLSHDYLGMQEELGDLMLQVIFHSQMAREENKFDITDVIQTLVEKLIRRHPHVFGNEKAQNAEEVKKKWDAIKSQEKKDRTSVLDGIPAGLPSLLKAEKLQKKVKKVGFEWPDHQGPLNKIREELEELTVEINKIDENNSNTEFISEELGDLLFSIVNLSRHFKIDVSLALEKTNRKFESRFRELEKRVKNDEIDITKLTLEELDNYWNQVKTEIKP